MMVRKVVAALTCVVMTHSLQASTDALVQLCRVWTTVKFLDPQLMTREIDWDPPLIHAIPAARAAKTAEESAAVVGSMLQESGDPVTRVIRVEHPAARPHLFADRRHRRP